MIRSIARWTGWSLCCGPLGFLLLGAVLVPLMGATWTWQAARTYVVYGGLGAVLVSLFATPAIVALYATWAFLSSRTRRLDRHVVAWSVLVAAPVGIALAVSHEHADALDVGRAFSSSEAAMLSVWFSASVWLGIAVPRLLSPSLRPGVYDHPRDTDRW